MCLNYQRTAYPVSISSSPEGAPFTIRNEDGVTVAKGTTPEVVSLKAGAGFFDGETYTIRSGSQTTILDSDLDEWYWGNIIFGGLVGMLIVDPATGAMWELPESITINSSSYDSGLDDFDDEEEYNVEVEGDDDEEISRAKKKVRKEKRRNKNNGTNTKTTIGLISKGITFPQEQNLLRECTLMFLIKKRICVKISSKPH